MQCREVTIFKLKEDIEEAENRLMFLLDYALMSGRTWTTIVQSPYLHLFYFKIVS